MSITDKIKVGIIGSQFEADIHAASIQMAAEVAEVVAVASPTPGNAAALARRYGISRVFTDYREMLKERDIEMVTIAAPNYLHAQMTADCAQAGKHVVCEKLMAMTIEEAEQMIHATQRAGVLLLYAEELFFTPKYVQAKEMADDGAFGKVHNLWLVNVSDYASELQPLAVTFAKVKRGCSVCGTVDLNALNASVA